MDYENGKYWTQETYINATEGYRYGGTDIYETRFDSLGDLYRFVQKEFGRCISRMYIDVKPGAAVLEANRVWPVKNGVQQVGWVFQGRARYEDSKDTYLKETWVHVYAQKPVFRTVQVEGPVIVESDVIETGLVVIE